MKLNDNLESSISHILSICFILSFAFFVLATYKLNNFPVHSVISSKLYFPPKQEPISPKKLDIHWKGINYRVLLLYKYQLYGMVVTCHNSKNLRDLYHRFWKDELNFADLCVIWGDNLRPRIYDGIRRGCVVFSHDSTSCYARWNIDSKCPGFFIDSFSNNHLLSIDKKLREKVLSLNRGDQVYISGYLCDYVGDDGKFFRTTSVLRNDVGEMACEIIWLKEVKILRKADLVWESIYNISRVMFWFVGLIILLWIGINLLLRIW